MFAQILSLLFPPSKHEAQLTKCGVLTPYPSTLRTPSGVSVLTCAHYDDPMLQAALLLLKKQRHPHATALLVQLLADVLIEECANTTLWDSGVVHIVPIPLSRKRKRARGFNQVTHICSALPDSLHRYVDVQMLQRVRDTPMQKTLSRKERLVNVRDVFAVAPSLRSKLSNAHVFLIDDVMTTGATLESAAQTLTRAGAHVTAIALARA